MGTTTSVPLYELGEPDINRSTDRGCPVAVAYPTTLTFGQGLGQGLGQDLGWGRAHYWVQDLVLGLGRACDRFR